MPIHRGYTTVRVKYVDSTNLEVMVPNITIFPEILFQERNPVRRL